MSKNISKILTKGTAKQRVILLANEIGERGYGGKGNLSDKELDELMDSFKTPEENKIYKKFKRQEELMRNVIGALGQIQNAFLERKSRLDGYVLLLYSYEEMEYVLNSLLTSLNVDPLYNKDKKLEKKILKTLVKEKLLYGTIEVEEVENKNFISIKTEKKEQSLDTMMRIVIDQAEEILILYKTILKAVRDSIEETGFKVKAYIKHIDNSEAIVKSSLSSQIVTPPMKVENLVLRYEDVNVDDILYKVYREKLI